MSTGGDSWSVLVPVKRLDRAKTRLALGADTRADIALAMAIDTIRAALSATSVREVVAITDDGRAAEAVRRLGAVIVPDLPDAGLNPALVHGASTVTETRIAALSSDLPALRPDDLDAVLRAALAHPRSVVADLAGTGTTLLAAGVVAEFAPAFGNDSLVRHVRSGAVDLTGIAGVSLRHDVDTLDALRAAVALGVGSETRRAVALLG